MLREQAEKVLHCAMTIGELLQISGAEVSRVEDTICRICLAYGAKRVDVFCITSSIVTTLFINEADFCTQTRRVTETKNDFRMLDELNQLSRYICAEQPEPEVILRRVEEIKRGSAYSFTSQLLVYALISGSFAVFFGGDWKDMFSSAFIGVLLKCLEALLRKTPVSVLFRALLCSCAGGVLASMAVQMSLGSHADMISIGNIMLLIPGVAFTNSLRDMLSGDTITGLTRFAESLLLALVIALGFAMAGFLF